jgi:hypothetical protein
VAPGFGVSGISEAVFFNGLLRSAFALLALSYLEAAGRLRGTAHNFKRIRFTVDTLDVFEHH